MYQRFYISTLKIVYFKFQNSSDSDPMGYCKRNSRKEQQVQGTREGLLSQGYIKFISILTPLPGLTLKEAFLPFFNAIFPFILFLNLFFPQRPSPSHKDCNLYIYPWLNVNQFFLIIVEHKFFLHLRDTFQIQFPRRRICRVSIFGNYIYARRRKVKKLWDVS